MDGIVKGLIFGSIIGDLIGQPNRNKAKNKCIEPQEDEALDWSSITERMMILMTALTKCDEYINVFKFAESLVEWQDKGIIELPPKTDRFLGMDLNFVLKQKNYLNNPIKSSKSSFCLMGGDRAPNDAIACNAICAISKNWYKNTILHSIIISYDARSIVSCIVQNYIIKNMLNKRVINWAELNAMCQKIIVQEKINKTRNLLEYNQFLQKSLNFKNYVYKKDAYNDFLVSLNIGDYEKCENQNYSMISMSLCIITAIDMEHNSVDCDYFVKRLKQISMCGGDTNTNCAAVGAIIGAYIGYDQLPQSWLRLIKHRIWIDSKIENFIKSHK